MANPPADVGVVESRAASKGSASDKLKLSNYLGILRDDPEDAAALDALKAIVAQRDKGRLGEQPVRLLEAARQAHEAKGELSAVAKLLEVEALLIEDDRDFALRLWKELGRLRADELLDAAGAREAYARAFELAPDDSEVEEAGKRLDQEEKSWRKFVKRFEDEADDATDTALKTSLLLRAASLVWQHNKKKGRDEEADGLFTRALAAAPGSRRAVHMYEVTLRQRQRWDGLVELLLQAADHSTQAADRINFNTRAGRIFVQRMNEAERAAACYERVLDLEASNAEAMTYLAEFFAKHERWDDLVAMYEQALSVRHKLEVEQGILLQIGMVHWRMRRTPGDAEPHFARLRKLNAAHPAVLDFYREHYAGAEHADAWLGVLADAQRVATEDSQKLELALQTARAAQEKPELRDKAIEAWKVVQRLDPKNRDALAELKALYLRAEKWNALTDVIKAEVEATPDDQVERKVSLLRELLAIYRDRLHMDGMIIGTLGRIVKLMPKDRDALAELATKYETAGRYNDLINVLSERAEALTDRPDKVDTHLRVAKLWIERFANYSQATAPLEKVLQIDPDNREALSQLKDIYEKKRAWKQLYEVLRKEKSVASDPAVRLANTVEMAKLAADRLQGYAEAIALWKEALGLDPRAPGAAEALEKLAEGEKDYGTLAELLEAELRQAQNNEARVRILQKLALLYGERLGSPERGTAAWRRILEIEPKHGRALRAVRDSLLAARDWDGLQSLYTGVRDFEGLVDVLSHEADQAQHVQLKVDLSFRAARIFEQSVGDPARALRSYERVLSVDSKNTRAAAALAALYEQDAKWSRLRAMLEVLRETATDKDKKLELLARLRELCITHLRDGDAALAYAIEAYRLAPESEAVRAALESAAEAALAFDKVVELYLERAAKARPEESTALRRRAATLALERLGQPAVAMAELEKLLQAKPDDVEVTASLERLYRAESRTADLRKLLAHRLEHDRNSSARWATLKELAQIEEDKLGDAEAAAGRYRSLSEIDPSDREVLVARDRLALSAERWPELAEVLEKRLDLDLEPSARVELAARLGHLYLDRLSQPDKALQVFEHVLEQDLQHGATVSALERAAEQHPKLVLRAERSLERVYERGGRYDKLLKVLRRRLESEKDDEETRRLRLRIAEISGSKLGDAAGAYGSLEAAFLEEPGDRELWERLAEAADRAGQHRALATAYATVVEAGDLGDEERLELAARAARLYDEVLGQPEEAEGLHKRILAGDPLSEVSFAALKELYTSTERWDELQALYRKRIADSLDGENKLDLLLQLCFLFEEILDRPEQAIEAYQHVLQLSPDHAAGRRTLERLYERTERWRDLYELLRGNLDSAHGHERIELLYRLGDLCETRLSEPGPAVDHYEAVLADQPNYLRAQQALGRLLGLEAHKQRIAVILEPLYESQGAYRDLARVLEIMQEDGRDEVAVAELSMRIGELHEQRTRDTEAAFAAYARAAESDPRNEPARRALARVASGRDAFRRQRAQVLQRGIEKMQSDPALAAEILLELGVLLDQYLGDRDGAERAYERLLALPTDNEDAVLAAARALEAIHLAKQDYAKLAGDIRRQIDLERDIARRGQLLVRLADLCESTLDAPEGAIEAHKKRLEDDPADAHALGALERLYEKTERYAQLVEVLRAHADASTNDADRRALLRRAAGLRDERLSDFEGAIAGYDEVLSSFGPDIETLRALAVLYERTERHADLLETLERELELLADPAERAELQFRMAELMRLHTGDLPRALEQYDAVLGFRPTHTGALAALDAIMHHEQEELRLEAARIAVPRYESSGTFERLLSVLEVQQNTDVLPDKLAALKRASEVSETSLHDSARAFDFMVRAVRAAAEDPSLREFLYELDRLTEVTARHAEHVAVLREIGPLVFDGELKPEVQRRIARTARTKLEDKKLALEHYAKLLEDLPEDTEALDALEVLNEATGDFRALIEVLKRKSELTSDGERRRQLLSRQAEIFERRLEEPESAIAVLEDLVADAGSPEAHAALERLYTQGKRYSDLRTLYERRLDRQAGSAVELRYQLARVLREQLEDTPGALAHLRDALTDDNQHAPSIGLLEDIMAGTGEARAEAAEILEPIYLARMHWPKLVSALETRIQGEQDPDERKRLLTRLGQLCEDQLEDFDAAFEVYARLFAEDSRDQDTWETLSRLAKVGGQWNRLGKVLGKPLEEESSLDESLARLAKYAGRIYIERVANHHRAAQLYEKALAFDPDDREAFGALQASYRQTASNDKLLLLYREQADRADSDDRRVKLLHERAQIFRETLHAPADAIATYREVLEVDPEDAEAIAGLEALLASAGDHAALAEHLRTRIDRSPGKGEEAALKLRLAELLEGKLDDVPGAIDVYEDIVRADSKEARAMWALERLVQQPAHTLRVTQILDPLYRKLDQWKKLVAVLEAQVELLEDDAERVRVLCEIGDFHERRGRDRALAFHAYMRAFMRDPGHDLARGHADRLAAELEVWNEHVQAYEEALQRTQDPVVVSSLLTTLARVHDERRGDPRAAIAAYERLAAHDPEDPGPLDSLESLHTMVGDWNGLTRVFARKVEHTYDAQEKGELLRRMGSVYEELLGDRGAAIEAYARAGSEDDTDVAAWEALDRLYGLERKPDQQSKALTRRIELSIDPGERVELGLRLGQLLDSGLHQPDQAIGAYQRALDEDAASKPALAALAALFQRQGMWPELVENLSQQQALAESSGERVKLLHRAAEILEQRQGLMDQAIDRLREALEIDPVHAPSTDALLRIAQSSEHRARAADVVEPLLRAQGRFDDLVQLIEGGLASLDDPLARRSELQRVAELHEHHRNRPGDAFAALCRAAGEDPSDESLLAELERLARSLGVFEKLAEVLGEQAGKNPDASLAALLYRRLARIFEEELRDDARAIEAFAQASERDDAPETLVALDRLYERTERWDGLLDVLERRIAASSEPALRTDFLIRLGNLREERFGDARGAFVAFKEVLDGDPAEQRALAGMERVGKHDNLAHQVLDTLDECYRQIGAVEKLAGLYDIRFRLAETDTERIRLLEEAARIWEVDLGKPGRALQYTRRVFELDPSRSEALQEVERLAEAAGSFEGVRGLVEGLVESGAVEGKTKRELCLRAADWYRDRLADPAAEERCVRWTLQVDTKQLVLHERLVALLRAPGREADLVKALREFAEVDGNVTERKQKLREAAQIAEETLSDLAIAGDCYGAILASDPEDRDALSELAMIFAAQQRFKEVIGLLERRLALETDAETRTTLRLRVAEIQEQDLGDTEQAIETYRAVVKDGASPQAMAALDRLYERASRFGELLELLERQRKGATTPAERADVGLRMAKLSEERLSDSERAVRELLQVLEEQPEHGQALDGLERIYAATARNAELVALLDRRAGQAAQIGDTRAELARLRTMAGVYESKLADPAQAIAAYARIHERDRSDRAALEALVRLLLDARRFEEAAPRMQELLALLNGEPAAALALRLADVADQELQNFALAEQALRDAERLSADPRDSRERLQALYEKHKAYEKLAQLLVGAEQSITDPAGKVALLNRVAGLYRESLGNPAAAVSYLERAVALVPDDRAALLQLCDLYIAASRPRDAIPVLEKIIASYGTRRAKEVAVYQHRLGHAYEGLGELDEALKRYDAAFKIDLTSVTILRDLGRLCLQKGDLDRAQKTYRALLLQKLGADSGITKADVYFHLGEISFKQNDKVKAKAMLERAIAEAGEHERARALLSQIT